MSQPETYLWNWRYGNDVSRLSFRSQWRRKINWKIKNSVCTAGSIRSEFSSEHPPRGAMQNVPTFEGNLVLGCFSKGKSINSCNFGGERFCEHQTGRIAQGEKGEPIAEETRITKPYQTWTYWELLIETIMFTRSFQTVSPKRKMVAIL